MKFSFAVGGGLRHQKCCVSIEPLKSEHFWLIFLVDRRLEVKDPDEKTPSAEKFCLSQKLKKW